MAQGKRIALLHYSAPPVVGGVETVMQEHAKLFRMNGHKVALVVGRGGQVEIDGVHTLQLPLIDSLKDSSVNRYVDHHGSPSLTFTTRSRRIERELHNVLRRFDLVIAYNVMTMHFNLPLTAALHSLLDKNLLPPMVAWTFDASWDDPLQKPHVRPGYPHDLLRTLRPEITYIVGSRERQKDFARMFGCSPSALRVVPTGVQMRFWWNLSDEGDRLIQSLKLSEADLFILQPVRITRLKNIPYALEIVAALRDRGLCVKYVVTGPADPHDADGATLFKELRTLRQALGLEREVTFAAEINPRSPETRALPMYVIRDLYQASDIILMTSLSEGFGIPIVEAGLIGKPVFCTDIAPFRETGCEFLHHFSVADTPDKVAEQIIEWARSDSIHQMRHRMWRQFTWRGINERYLEPLVQEITIGERPAIRHRQLESAQELGSQSLNNGRSLGNGRAHQNGRLAGPG